MPVSVCSLKTDKAQTIAADGRYHVVRFPFGDGESSDRFNMHPVLQPDGYSVLSWSGDDRSGLVWPSFDGWGSLTAMIQWDAGSYTELRDRFVRDPLGLADGADPTATDHRVPSPGTQCFTKHHEIFVCSGTPISLMVAHNDIVPRRIVLAEFKLAIYT